LLLPRVLTIIVLLLIAFALAGGNLWFAAARSTIPLELDLVIVRKETRHEKHPPKDDVYLLHASASTLHVDQVVYDAVHEGDRLRKTAWSRQLAADGRQIPLAYSRDVRGMMFAMPCTLTVVLLLAAIAVSLPLRLKYARNKT
jgi:hypothetical protein